MSGGARVQLIAASLGLATIVGTACAPGGGTATGTTTATTPAPTGPTTPDRPFGLRTKESGCVAANGLQDRACTPGAVFPSAAAGQICVRGYSTSVRDVPEEVKRQVYASYGIQTRKPGEYEVDHLVSLELGGSNDIANLWPEAAEPRPGFHEKDSVENYLHEQVCSGAMSLQDAQRQIATNWLEVYNRLPRRGRT